MEPKKLGQQIKELRLRSALSQEELAEVSGLTIRSIQRIENDQTVPRGDSLKRIAKALYVTVEELTGGAETNYAKQVIFVREDPKITLILILSVLGYLIHPVLGVIFPTIIWTLYKNTNRSVREVGLKMIKLELVWCTILSLIYAYILSIKFFHLNLPVPGNGKLLIVFIAAFYVVNFCAILIALFRYLWTNKAFQTS